MCDSDSYKAFVKGGSQFSASIDINFERKDKYREALDEMNDISTVLLVGSNLITVFLIQTNPKYKLSLITLNSLVTIYLGNLSRLDKLESSYTF